MNSMSKNLAGTAFPQPVETVESAAETHLKPIGRIIAQGLGFQNQDAIDRVIGQLYNGVRQTRVYSRSRPGEVALMVATAGLAAWFLLGTRPGRRLFDYGAERLLPDLAGWLSHQLPPVKH